MVSSDAKHFCMRFVDGLQICWGTTSYSGYGDSTVTLLAAFDNSYYSVALTQYRSTGITATNMNGQIVRVKNTSSFIINRGYSEQTNCDYICIGNWK